MASAIPTQSRAVDPFASYNSSTVNELTRMISRGNDGLTDYNAIQVSSDSTSPNTQCVVSTGTIFKDDVLITFTASHVVNFEDPNHYVSFGSGFNEAGIYYIVLDYTYAKSRPAPQAAVKILKPSQIPHPSLGTSLFFLKAVSVIFTGATFVIDEFYDYDPSTPSVQRTYTFLYFGVVTNLPTHVTSRDQGRVVYESENDAFWFGLAHRWVQIGSETGGVIVSDVDNDSTAIWIGCIAYVDANNKAQPAIATSNYTRADIGVLTLGLASLHEATSTLVGTLENVRVESGASIGVGDVLYLSSTDAGKVTNVRPTNFIQDIGRAISSGDDSTPIKILFLPRTILSTSLKGVIETTDWVEDSSNSYYFDIDITALDTTGFVVITSFFAENSGVMELILPTNVQLIDSLSDEHYDILRVWMSTNTLDVFYNISVGSGTGTSSGSGSGTTDHSLLYNLDYASSGHTGFSPNPHDHTYHSDPPSIPSGEIILFEKDSSVVGYSILTGIDDDVVYITKGSGAGGEAGATEKTGGTWTQPVHSHTVAYDGSTHVHAIADDGSHNHKWKDYVGANDERTWTVSGTEINLNSGSTGANSQGVLITDSGGTPKTIDQDFYTELDGLHDHGGETGLSDDLHNHGGSTGSSNTVNTWRPKGRNFTRQQKS